MAMTQTAGQPLAGKRMNAVDWIAMVLLIIGGLNWGLVALFEFDLVAAMFGDMSVLARVVYALVGLAALYSIYLSARKLPHRTTTTA